MQAGLKADRWILVWCLPLGVLGYFFPLLFLLRNSAVDCTSIDVFNYLHLSRLNGQFTAICYIRVICWLLVLTSLVLTLLACPHLVFH